MGLTTLTMLSEIASMFNNFLRNKIIKVFVNGTISYFSDWLSTLFNGMLLEENAFNEKIYEGV